MESLRQIFQLQGASKALAKIQNQLRDSPELAPRIDLEMRAIGAPDWSEKIRAELGLDVPKDITATMLSGTYALVAPSDQTSEFIMTDIPVLNLGGSGAERSEIWSILAPKLSIVFFPERSADARYRAFAQNLSA